MGELTSWLQQIKADYGDGTPEERTVRDTTPPIAEWAKEHWIEIVAGKFRTVSSSPFRSVKVKVRGKVWAGPDPHSAGP